MISLDIDFNDRAPKTFAELHPGEVFAFANLRGGLSSMKQATIAIRTAQGWINTDDFMHYKAERDSVAKVFSFGESRVLTAD